MGILRFQTGGADLTPESYIPFCWAWASAVPVCRCTVGAVGIKDEAIGELIRTLRVREGLSQAELAVMLTDRGIPGMHPQTITKIEAGQRPLRLTEAIAITDAMAVPLDALRVRNQTEHSLMRRVDTLNALRGRVRVAQRELREAERQQRGAMEVLEHAVEELAAFEAQNADFIESLERHPAHKAFDTPSGRALLEEMKGVSGGEHQEEA